MNEEFQTGWMIIDSKQNWLVFTVREFRQDCIDDYIQSKKCTWVDLERLGYSCKKVKIQLGEN